MNKKLLKRMLELSDIKPVIKESKMSLSNFALVKESVNGKTYAIVRESNKYYIKNTDTKKNLTESDFDYIGGVSNKTKKSFHSYEEATRHLNLMFEEINNHYDVGNVNLLEAETLNEKKFVLKLGKPKSKPKADTGADSAFGGEDDTEEGGFDFGGDTEEKKTTDKGGDDTEEGGFDFGGGDDTEEGGDEFDFGGGDDTEEDDTEDTEEGGDEFGFGGGDDTDEDDTDVEEFDDEDDEIRDIQSTTGKLGQQIRDVEDLSSDMQKWVAKSVLSAMDLENMDSDDKKDIIRTIKKKSQEEPEESEEQSFDFGDEETEKSGDESFDFGGDKPVEENYDNYMKEEICSNCDGTGIDAMTGEPCEMCSGDINHNTYMNDNMSYMSYMKDKKESYSDTELDEWLMDMEMAGFVGRPSYNSYMGEDNPRIGGDENHENLLFDSYMEDVMELPHLNKMETAEQAMAYREVAEMADKYGFNLGWCHKDKSEDPEEIAVYLDVKDGKEKLMKVRINSMGNIEMGTMRGMHFIGEPIDTLSDFDEALGEDGKLNDMGPQREKAPEKPDRGTETIPGTPTKTPDKDRPSRRPFNPPPHITPGEEPGPKARVRRMNNLDPTMAPAPAPSKPSPKEQPGTKPGTPDKTPDKDRPSRRPFNPPPHITPGEEPGPKARGRRSYMSYMGDENETPKPSHEKPKRPDRNPFQRPNINEDDVEFS